MLLYIMVTVLSLVIEYCHVTLSPGDPITPYACRFPKSVTVVSAVRSGLQRRVTRELANNSETPLTNLFLIVLMTGMSSGHSQHG